MFIVVEGQNGTGKSMISRTLADMLHTSALHSSKQKFLQGIDNVLDSEPQLAVARFIYYLGIVQQKVNEVDFERKEPIVFDRYFYGTVALHIAIDKIYNKGINYAFINRLKELLYIIFPTPDVFILLRTDEEIRLNRVANRLKQNTVFDDDRKISSLVMNEFESIKIDLRKKGVDILDFDTSEYDLPQTIEKIFSYIHEKLSTDKNENPKTNRGSSL